MNDKDKIISKLKSINKDSYPTIQAVLNSMKKFCKHNNIEFSKYEEDIMLYIEQYIF